MLAVYETIDLGLISTLNRISTSSNDPPIFDLFQGNHPVFLTDPIHDDTIYVYHAFGVHALNLGPVLQSLAFALRTDDSDAGTSLDATLRESAGTAVQPILSTFSIERKFVQSHLPRLSAIHIFIGVRIRLWLSPSPTTYTSHTVSSPSLPPCESHHSL